MKPEPRPPAITAGRWLGLDRDAAARFSFLLLIPAVAGATLYKAAGAAHEGLHRHGSAPGDVLGRRTSAEIDTSAVLSSTLSLPTGRRSRNFGVRPYPLVKIL